jgi:hypothetical protein
MPTAYLSMNMDTSSYKTGPQHVYSQLLMYKFSTNKMQSSVTKASVLHLMFVDPCIIV